MKISKLVLFIILAISLAGCGSPYMKDGKYILAMRLKQGNTYKYESSQIMEMNQEYMGTKIQVNQEMTMKYSMKVEKVDEDGLMHTSCKIESIYAKQKAGDQESVFDSQNKEGNSDNLAILNDMVGLKYKMTIKPDGIVKDISGWDALAEKLNQVIDSMPQQVRKQMKDLANNYSDDGMLEMMSRAFSYYPDKPVSVGDSWTKNYDFKIGFPFHVESQWKLESVKDDPESGKPVVKSTVESKVFTDKDASFADTDMMKIKVSLNGTQKGYVDYNLDNGWLIKQELVQDISGKMNVTAMGGNFEIPVTIKIKVKTSNID